MTECRRRTHKHSQTYYRSDLLFVLVTERSAVDPTVFRAKPIGRSAIRTPVEAAVNSIYIVLCAAAAISAAQVIWSGN